MKTTMTQTTTTDDEATCPACDGTLSESDFGGDIHTDHGARGNYVRGKCPVCGVSLLCYEQGNGWDPAECQIDVEDAE